MSQAGVVRQEKSRVLILGLDGGTLDVILPLVEAGRMPNVGQLIAEGSHGVLRSTVPPITPTAWTSFMTGVNPGKHGIFDFQRPVAGTYEFRPVPAGQHGYKSLWRLLSECGKAVVSLDVPFTYPAEPVNGCLISGYGTPGDEDIPFTWPRDLAQELRAEFGECRPAVLEEEPSLTGRFFQEWDDLLINRTAIAHYLWSRVDWDLFMLVLGVTDNVQHVLWNYLDPRHRDYYAPGAPEYREALYGYYEKSDALLGTLLDRADGDTTTLIMSDHGFGSTRPGLYLSRLLIDLGVLRYRSGPLGARGGKGLMRSLLKVYTSAPWLRRALLSIGSHSKTALKRILQKSALVPSLDNVDWAHTQAFPSSFGLHIYINRRDRYPDGTVQPGEEYERVVEDLRQALLTTVEPDTGEPIIRAVHRGDEVYRGRRVDSAPDLIVEYTNFFDPTPRPERSSVLRDIGGSHVPEGTLIAAGRAIRGGKIEGAVIEDLAPTVLHLLGLPVPMDLDGSVLRGLLSQEWLESHPVTYRDSEDEGLSDEDGYIYSDEEVEQIRAQLSGLGYIS